MAQNFQQRFPSVTYSWANVPTNTVQAQAMAWMGLARARENYLNGEVAAGRLRSWTRDDDVFPKVNELLDGLLKNAPTDPGLLENAAGLIQGYTAIMKDNGEMAALRGAASALRGRLAAGYYRDGANPPFYFYVDNDKAIVLGSSRGPINKTYAANTDKYVALVADLKKNGKPVDKATAEASARGPSTPQSAEMPPAVVNVEASQQSFLDRLVTDPLGAVKDAFTNPWVIGGTAVVGAGLVWWFFLRSPNPPAATVANRRKHRRKHRNLPVEEIEVEEEEDIDGDEVEVEEEEEEVEETPVRRPRRHTKHAKKSRRARK